MSSSGASQRHLPGLDSWTDEERELQRDLRAGNTIVVNLKRHGCLVTWAKEQGLLVRVDRSSAWGNPFVLGKDGCRDEVIHKYADQHLPDRPDLTSRVDELRGKALACWCAPERCHGDVLAALAERATP